MYRTLYGRYCSIGLKSCCQFFVSIPLTDRSDFPDFDMLGMKTQSNSLFALLSLALACTCGCVSKQQKVVLREQLSTTNKLATRLDSPQASDFGESVAPLYAAAPRSSETELPTEWLSLSLEETIALSLQHAPILRSLNAQVTVNPQSARSAFDSAIQDSDPNFGTQAALAQFDSNLTASLNHANNDDVFNNSILGGGATEIVQDLLTGSAGINRTLWTGTQLSLDGNITHDSNDNPASIFPSSYRAFWQAQVQQPLLQGRGLAFNRIAGPNASTGFLGTSGFLISRINTDISVDEFEKGVIAHIDEVINAYWDLHFAVKNFKTSKTARDSSQETWNTVKARFDNDLPGGEADAEAQAREQYYQFEEQMFAALNGDARSGILGVYQTEANLRRLIGMPQSDDRLLWAKDEPTTVETVYDWDSLSSHAISNRVEARQQSRRVRQRELELLASRNFLLPRLDAVATFRNTGFGDQLTGGGDIPFSSAANDLFSGDHNEWELGVQLDVPVGYRQAHAGVRNSELELRRERAVLAETQQQILHELGTSLRQTHQAAKSTKLNYNRVKAARDAWQSRLAAFEADAVSVDLVLDSVQRLADAESRFERAQANFQISNAAIKRGAGNLLQEFGIVLDRSQLERGSPAVVTATVQ